ncbi:MAG: metallophosphoesterase family protein [Sulfurimonas sp.]|uniref:metallophosphoesterase family protein n=1 Tax=Sulfurimonas sp. TaxID=2022749 RepID=UPI00261A0703|nr:metallophosphoesterase family protein [Sulfurimonas sp.]MDD5372781.1 metallophosphoesterase family protein [Sulfurimonas sp.]
MKIGIISDTHRKVKKAARAIDTLIRDGAEVILHAGDIVELDILKLLKESGVKYIAVYGNNDAHLAEYHSEYHLVQEPYYFRLANTNFKLMHLPFYLIPDADVVIYGHTHKSSVEFMNNTLFINSGEVCARNKPVSEWAMLEIKEREFIVTLYTRTNKSDSIEKQEFNFKREENE